MQEQQPGKVKRFFKETARVLRITKRPDATEYKSLLKVTSIGVAIIGTIGFVIFIIRQLLF